MKGKGWEEDLEDYRAAEDDAADELWKDEVDVQNYAFRELQRKKYKDWDDTDSSQGNYCRFIWYLGNNVTVGLNVHYPAAGKAAGNMYILRMQGVALTTPAEMVNNAPPARPATTRTWASLR